MRAALARLPRWMPPRVVVRLASGLWFCLLCGPGFLLTVGALPRAPAMTPDDAAHVILSGVTLFGAPAALFGAMLGPAIVKAGAGRAFLLGALVTVLNCLAFSARMAIGRLVPQGLYGFLESTAGYFVVGLVAEFLFMAGMPYLISGLAAIWFRSLWRRFQPI